MFRAYTQCQFYLTIFTKNRQSAKPFQPACLPPLPCHPNAHRPPCRPQMSSSKKHRDQGLSPASIGWLGLLSLRLCNGGPSSSWTLSVPLKLTNGNVIYLFLSFRFLDPSLQSVCLLGFHWLSLVASNSHLLPLFSRPSTGLPPSTGCGACPSHSNKAHTDLTP